jgi:hypothetical protein
MVDELKASEAELGWYDRELNRMTTEQIVERAIKRLKADLAELSAATRTPPEVSEEMVERLLSPKVLVAAAMQIEPELGCWKDGGQEWEWRRGQEVKHAERIVRAILAALKEE